MLFIVLLPGTIDRLGVRGQHLHGNCEYKHITEPRKPHVFFLFSRVFNIHQLQYLSIIAAGFTTNPSVWVNNPLWPLIALCIKFLFLYIFTGCGAFYRTLLTTTSRPPQL